MSAAEQVRALAESGTPAPWVSEKWEIAGHQGHIATARKPENAAKIVAAVNALGPLADLIEALAPHRCRPRVNACVACDWPWPCPTSTARDDLLAALGVTE